MVDEWSRVLAYTNQWVLGSNTHCVNSISMKLFLLIIIIIISNNFSPFLSGNCPPDYSNGLSGGLFQWIVRRLFQWTVRRKSLSGRTISGMVTGQSPENCISFNYEISQFSGLLSGAESAGVRPDNVGDCKDL